MSAKAVMEAERSGVYRTPAHVAALRKEAGKAGFQWFDVPLQAVSGKKQFFAVCAKQLKLPSYFGGNWDALADCVRDFSWVSGAGYVLHISGSEKFSQAAPDEYQTALAVLREAAEFWKEKSVPFMVFVDAAGDLPAF